MKFIVKEVNKTTKTRFINIVVEAMDWHEDGWTARGNVVFNDTNKVIEWTARHKTSCIVTLGDAFGQYPEYIQDEVKTLIRSVLGATNLPVCRTFSLRM